MRTRQAAERRRLLAPLVRGGRVATTTARTDRQRRMHTCVKHGGSPAISILLASSGRGAGVVLLASRTGDVASTGGLAQPQPALRNPTISIRQQYHFG